MGYVPAAVLYSWHVCFYFCYCAFWGTVSTVVTENLLGMQGWDWRPVVKGSICALVQDQQNFNTECKSSKICFWKCCGLPSVLASCEEVSSMRLFLSDHGIDLTLLELAGTFQNHSSGVWWSIWPLIAGENLSEKRAFCLLRGLPWYITSGHWNVILMLSAEDHAIYFSCAISLF